MSRVRGLRDPERRPEVDARPRHPPGEHRLHLRHRVFESLPVLHEHLRLPHHPWAGPGRRHRAQGGAPRPQGLRGHRGRRRALHRRQPHAPRAAPQRGRDHPALQQPHLWPDQGAVLADERAGEDHEVHAHGLGRSAGEPALLRPRVRGHLRGADGGPQHPAHGADAAACRGPQGHRLPRDPPELQRLQRSRVEGALRQGVEAPVRAAARARQAAALRPAAGSQGPHHGRA